MLTPPRPLDSGKIVGADEAVEGGLTADRERALCELPESPKTAYRHRPARTRIFLFLSCSQAFQDPSARIRMNIADACGTTRPLRHLRASDLRPTPRRPDARTHRAHPGDRSSSLAPAGLRPRRVVERADRRKMSVGAPYPGKIIAIHLSELAARSSRRRIIFSPPPRGIRPDRVPAARRFASHRLHRHLSTLDQR